MTPLQRESKPRTPRLAARLAGVVSGTLVVVVISLSPPLRDALIALEPVIAPILFLLAFTASAIQWALRAQGAGRCLREGRRAEAATARFLGRWAWPLATLAFLAPLLSQWHKGPIGASAAFSALLGHIPFGDAHLHFEGASRLLNAGELNGFSERRPLNAAWLSVLLAFGGSQLPFALVVQAALLAIATLWCARVVSIRVGLYASLAFFGLVLGLFRMFVVAVLTEPLGATFACLALAILLSGAARESLAVIAVGFVCLDAALRTRPGAQFLLPLLMAWGVYTMRGRRRRAAACVLAVFLGGALHTSLLNRFYGSGEASAVSYPAFTLYGLTRDSNYQRAWQDYGSELERLPDENARARFLYARALDSLRRDPLPFLRALADNELEFIFKLRRELVRLVSIGTLADTPERRVAATEAEWRRDWLMGSPVLVLVVVGFGVHLARSRWDERVFWAAVLGGLATSAPFVFGDTGMRAMTAGLPFIALAAGSGLAGRARRVASRQGLALERTTVTWSGAVGLALLVVSLAGPLAARILSPAPASSRLRGIAPEREAVVELRTCPAVLISNRGQSSLKLPLVDSGELDARLSLARVTEDGLRQVRLPAVLLSCYDHLFERQLLLVAPHTLFKRASARDRLALQPLPGDERFHEVLSSAPVP